MTYRPSTVERAFELARGGTCKSVEEVRKQLRVEKFDAVDAHTKGSLISRQLNAIIAGK